MGGGPPAGRGATASSTWRRCSAARRRTLPEAKGASFGPAAKKGGDIGGLRSAGARQHTGGVEVQMASGVKSHAEISQRGGARAIVPEVVQHLLQRVDDALPR